MTAGTAMMPTTIRQSPVAATSPRAIVMMPPKTSPPGQPACRMFSHFVFSLLNIVATTGLMNASTVPLPSARITLPQ